MNKVLLATVIFLSSLGLISPSHGQISVLDSNYPGGSEGFWEKFQTNFEFPESTMKSKRYGTALIRMLINSDGLPVRSYFLNQIDSDISKAISISLGKMADEWETFPADTKLFMSIRFSYDQDYLSMLKVNKSSLTQEFAEFLYIKESGNEEAINYKKEYNKTLKAAKSAMKDAAFRKARNNYSRLIAINPYEIDFYTKRIEIETVMGAKVFACSDVQVLQNILNYQGEVLLHGCK